MKKNFHKYQTLVLGLSIVVGVLVLRVIFGGFIEDRLDRRWPGGKHGFTASNIEKAAADVANRKTYLKAYIEDCQRFPLNLEDAYKSVENGPKGCSPMKPTDEGVVTSWIDPWGRMYQIRYDKEHRKIQVRSRGRNLDDKRDDIVNETTWGNAAIFFNKEIEKCKKLASDDKNCVFNRGWH